MEQFNEVSGLNQYYKAIRKAVYSLKKGDLIDENRGINILKTQFDEMESPGPLAGKLYKSLVISFQVDEEVISNYPLLADEFDQVIQKYYNQLREE